VTNRARHPSPDRRDAAQLPLVTEQRALHQREQCKGRWRRRCHADSSSGVTLTDSVASGNSATSGGGIYNNGGSVTLSGTTTFTGNTPDNCIGVVGC